MQSYPRLIFFLTLVFTQYAISSDPSVDLHTATLVGYGYSSDSQQVTEKACFNASVAKISGREVKMHFEEAASALDLQRLLGVDLCSLGGYGLFATNARAEYIRSLQEDEYSVSLNYYMAYQEEVTVNIISVHDHALTDFGREVYNDRKLFKEFGLICGDHYIASFVQGVVFSAGLKIILDNRDDKDKLVSSIGSSYGSFADVASKIQAVSNSNNISGTIQIHASQFGGDVAGLADIPKGNIPYCNLKNTSQCSSIIKALISYAQKFGKQIRNHRAVEPLGSFEYFSIERLGLIAPDSLVTPKVAQSRKDLAFKLKENQYYQQKLSPFVSNKYPVKLQDKLMKHLNALSNRAKQNLKLMMDPKNGAARCFNTPNLCEEIKIKIYNSLKDIKTNDLKFVVSMKYIFPFKFEDILCMYYNTGEDLKSWKSVPTAQGDSYKIEMVKFLVSGESFKYKFKKDGDYFHFNGTWNSLQQAYVGRLDNYFGISFKKTEENHIQKLQLSPFFFEKYNSSMDTV